MNIQEEIKSMDLDIRQMLKAFLLNMHLLTPKERGVIVRIFDDLYPPIAPIEKEFYVKTNKERKE